MFIRTAFFASPFPCLFAVTYFWAIFVKLMGVTVKARTEVLCWVCTVQVWLFRNMALSCSHTDHCKTEIIGNRARSKSSAFENLITQPKPGPATSETLKCHSFAVVMGSTSPSNLASRHPFPWFPLKLLVSILSLSCQGLVHPAHLALAALELWGLLGCACCTLGVSQWSWTSHSCCAACQWPASLAEWPPLQLSAITWGGKWVSLDFLNISFPCVSAATHGG